VPGYPQRRPGCPGGSRIGGRALRIIPGGWSEAGEPVQEAGVLVPFGQVAGDDAGIGGFEGAATRGLDSAWTNQTPGGWDPLGVLGPFGQEGPAELGTAIVPTYPRHPVTMAAEALTVQSAMGGRLTLGIGPSHEHAMTGMFGIPYTAPASHTREYLEVLLPLMRGEHVRHKGRSFTVDYQINVPARPPRVLLSALGPRMLRIARELTDGTIAVWVRPTRSPTTSSPPSGMAGGSWST
jgi:Luciferase-like monooxygenase